MEVSRQLCRFGVGPYRLAVDVEHVQEVLRPQRLTPAPLSPPAVCGLLNLRGQIVVVLDPRPALGLADPCPDAGLYLVLRFEQGVAGLLVDEVAEVADYRRGQVGPVPATVAPQAARLAVGCLRQAGEPVLLVTPEAMLRTALEPSAQS